MGEKNQDVNTKKLEKDFRTFQKEWRKFLSNDFHHLLADVSTLIKQNDKQHSEIKQGVRLMQDNMETMNGTVKTQLETAKRIVNILEKGQ